MNYPNLEVVVVDNGSTDASPEAIRERFPQVTVVETGQNLGYAGGNNVGIRYALTKGAEYVLLLNNDTVVDPQLVFDLVRVASERREAGIYQPKIYFYADPKRIWFSTVRWVPSEGFLVHEEKGELDLGGDREPEATAYACGCALFFHADVARQVGLFDPVFFLCWEEIDWCFRARAHGYCSLFVPSAKIWHKVAGSMGGPESPMRAYFDFRNQLLWAERHLSPEARGKVRHRSFVVARKAARRVMGGLLRGVLRPEPLAVMHASVDYLCRRFGDCPSWIRRRATGTA